MVSNNCGGQVEIRCFSFLKTICDERDWPFPFYYQLKEGCSAKKLVELLELPKEKIEAVFINGRAMPFEEAMVRAGDRVGFVPPGTPGPYRALLGMVSGKE